MGKTRQPCAMTGYIHGVIGGRAISCAPDSRTIDADGSVHPTEDTGFRAGDWTAPAPVHVVCTYIKQLRQQSHVPTMPTVSHERRFVGPAGLRPHCTLIAYSPAAPIVARPLADLPVYANDRAFGGKTTCETTMKVTRRPTPVKDSEPTSGETIPKPRAYEPEIVLGETVNENWPDTESARPKSPADRSYRWRPSPQTPGPRFGWHPWTALPTGMHGPQFPDIVTAGDRMTRPRANDDSTEVKRRFLGKAKRLPPIPLTQAEFDQLTPEQIAQIREKRRDRLPAKCPEGPRIDAEGQRRHGWFESEDIEDSHSFDAAHQAMPLKHKPKLSRVPDSMRPVIEAYGLAQRGKTQNEIAAEMGKTRKQIRTLLMKAGEIKAEA